MNSDYFQLESTKTLHKIASSKFETKEYPLEKHFDTKVVERKPFNVCTGCEG